MRRSFLYELGNFSNPESGESVFGGDPGGLESFHDDGLCSDECRDGLVECSEISGCGCSDGVGGEGGHGGVGVKVEDKEEGLGEDEEEDEDEEDDCGDEFTLEFRDEFQKGYFSQKLDIADGIPHEPGIFGSEWESTHFVFL